MTKSKGILAPRHAWTAEEDAELRRRYPNELAGDLAAVFGVAVQAIYGRAQKLELKKSPEFFTSPLSGRLDGVRGKSSRFTKGNVPWTAGRNGLHIGGEETQFKPGQMPHNTSKIGDYRTTKDGILQRKISNDKGNNSQRWRGVHERVWIEANGPLPPKHIVIFKPGMRTAELGEITVDRVECISLAENMRRNTIHNMPEEIVELVQLRGVLTRQINKRRKP